MKFKRSFTWLTVAVLVLAGLGLWLEHAMVTCFNTPAGGDTQIVEQVVVVAPGEGMRRVALRLHEKGLVRHPLAFRIMARWLGADTRIKAGEYGFFAHMPPSHILEDLVKGRVKCYRVTIPEGFSLTQIAEAVEKSGLVTGAAFLEAARDPALARRLGLDGRGLEGYLFPDTYHFERGATAEKMIGAMVARFKKAFTDAWRERAKALGMGEHDVVTLASIVEKETGLAAERPLIAGVFLNRLRRGMRLESDPTVIYGIDGFDGNLTRRHLETLTPYNTYRISGLPPTPIASPGAAALEAVLFPAETGYLYFVSKGDGSHHFSDTYSAHLKAVRMYHLKGG